LHVQSSVETAEFSYRLLSAGIYFSALN